MTGRKPGRHTATTDAPVLRWRAVVAGTGLMLVLIAGLTMLLWKVAGPGADGQAHPPAPRVTVTAEPSAVPMAGVSESAAPPITAPTAPDALASAGDQEPAISVEPSINLDQHSLDDPASPWVVVNKARPVNPQSWEPPQLDTVGGTAMVPVAAAALQDMVDGSAAAGTPLRTASGYRDYGFQQSIYDNYVARSGTDHADRFSARPGYSEHQTGWAVDVYASEECRIKKCFADEEAGVWLFDHAREYGFVVRYPQGAEAVTGYTFEPWHMRYVGPELATYMHESSIPTLEQAFGLPAAPNYG